MATEHVRRTLMIVPAADRARANNRAKQTFDAQGGDRTFAVPLSPTGAAPATHYAACAAFREAEYQAVDALARSEFSTAALFDCSLDRPAEYPLAVLAGLGLAIIPPAVSDP